MSGLVHGDIRTRKIVVFLVGSQRDVKVTSAHYALHLRAFMQAAKVPGNRKLHFLCDEFTNSPLQALTEDLTTLRGYGGRVLLACQAMSEIVRKFGAEAAKTISSVCTIKQFFGVSDPEEAEKLSKLLGQSVHVAPAYSFSGSDDKVGASLDDKGRSLMTADDILAMPRDLQIILIDGMRPILARKLYQNEIAPICEMLDPNPLEGGLTPDPIIHIDYGAAPCRPSKSSPDGSPVLLLPKPAEDEDASFGSPDWRC